MKVDDLTRAYLQKARVRFKALFFYRENQAYSDVVREAQELVELLLKAVLRSLGVEVPKIHDVGRTLEKHRHMLPGVLNRGIRFRGRRPGDKRCRTGVADGAGSVW